MENHQQAPSITVPKLKVAIAGGGLVGALSACFFAKRGHEVHLFEYRGDIREMEHVQGRSINLALSVRGRKALRQVGLEEAAVNNHGIPMYARMIHSVNGKRTPIPYGQADQCIYSVGRRFLNELLLTGKVIKLFLPGGVTRPALLRFKFLNRRIRNAIHMDYPFQKRKIRKESSASGFTIATVLEKSAEKFPNVHLHFNHKLVTADLNQGLMTFERQESKEVVIESADLVVGADGAYSMMRRQLMKQPMFNFSQTYIEHGYLELCIPANEKGEHKMEKNYLHIWPRGKFMMIALPNQDGSWTVTLFMPFKYFDNLNSESKLLSFFQMYYPDAIPLIGEDRLIKDFFHTKPSPLVSIKCNPYHVGKSAVIIGDAAHAMVPFYGQGMNAGFEDCTLLDELFMKNNFDLSKSLNEFSIIRNPDAEAICNLAMYNYVEMRDLVNRPSFLIRKKIDNFLHWLAPTVWIPLYTSVTFSHMRYSDCIKNKEWQDKIITSSLMITGVCSVVGLTIAIMNWQSHIEETYHSALSKLQTFYW